VSKTRWPSKDLYRVLGLLWLTTVLYKVGGLIVPVNDYMYIIFNILYRPWVKWYHPDVTVKGLGVLWRNVQCVMQKTQKQFLDAKREWSCG